MKAYYSMIQYCPDVSRAEAANVGVLLFCPEAGYIEAKTSAGNDRVRRFFGEYAIDLERLNAAKQSIEARLRSYGAEFRTLEDLDKFIATRANEILITPPRSMTVSDPEWELQELFNELVGGRQRREVATDDVTAKLESVFGESRFHGRVQLHRKIIVPVLNKSIDFPAAYRNGILNLVRVVRLPAVLSKATNAAVQCAGEGEMIARHEIEGCKARQIVVYGFGNAKAEPASDERIQSIFEDFKARAVRASRIDEFAGEVEREAHT